MITAVLSKKGGVGKTTTSVHLAAALALQGRRCLVVDLDSNAGASLSLGLDKSDLGQGMADVLLRDLAAREAIRATGVEGLDLLPASVDLRGAEVELAGRWHKEKVLKRCLEPVAGDYDFIFLDCAPAMDLLSRNAVVAADGFLIPTTCHFLALEGLEHLVATAERLALRVGHAARFLGLVLTMVDYRIRSTRQAVASVRERFGAKVFAVEIRTNVSLAEAPSFGQTVYQYKPRSTGARAYRLLADELLWQIGAGRASAALAEAAASAPLG